MPRAALIAVVMTAFAANSLLNREALAGADTGPAAFAALRLASGAAMLCALAYWRAGRARLAAALRPSKAAALAVYVLGFSFAYVSLPAGLGALILFGGVQLTMLAGSLVMGEVVPARRLAGGAVAFAGLVWLLAPNAAGAVPLAGAALMTAAAIGWGIFTLMGRGSSDALADTAGAFALALVPGLALVAVLPDGITASGAALAVVSGAVTSGLGYALWYALLPGLSPSLAGVVQLSVPVLALLGGVPLLGEALTLRLVLAAAVVLGGLAIAVTARSGAAAPGS